MLIDTHCHLALIIKKDFDRLLTLSERSLATAYIYEAAQVGVTTIVNVGTSLVESINCVELAKTFEPCFATIGIHPNDCTETWPHDIKNMKKLWFDDRNTRHKNYKIVGIGECGLDRHYPGYNIQRQKDAFKAQIELALASSLALVVHTRDAGEETLHVLDEYKRQGLKGVIHCFSEDQGFADTALEFGFVLGIGGTITYPKNEQLRTICKTIPLEKIILETDAPFLPLQQMRGKQNHPKYIRDIAAFLATIRNESTTDIARITSTTATELFALPNIVQ